MGQKQTSDRRPLMSALPPKADIGTQSRNVRFVPKADIAVDGFNDVRNPRPGLLDRVPGIAELGGSFHDSPVADQSHGEQGGRSGRGRSTIGRIASLCLPS